ncbi:MAG: response regulator [Deltaproteobacteria bacterium]|nr:response regulator [Deltaproteobacteria bacterium]
MSPPRRILIVDDSTAMRLLLAHAVGRLPDVVVDQAENGLAALQALKATPASPYDLVLLDINMPVLDGMKLLGMMQADPAFAATTLCVVTTEESPEAEAQARALGARYFLRKPVSRRSVELVLAEVFGLPRPPEPGVAGGDGR